MILGDFFYRTVAGLIIHYSYCIFMFTENKKIDCVEYKCTAWVGLVALLFLCKKIF